MQVTGRFTYDPKEKSIAFIPDGGYCLSVMDIALPGSDCVSVGAKGEKRQYREIRLWFVRGQYDRPQVATAEPAPIAWRLRPGKWAAYALALPGILVDMWQMMQRKKSEGARPPYKNGVQLGLAREFGIYWPPMRKRALQGWAMLGGVSLLAILGYLLFSAA